MDIALWIFALYGAISLVIESYLIINGKARRTLGRRLMGY